MDREWYLPHLPVVNPNQPGKVRSVLNRAAKFHGAYLNKSLLTGPDLQQKPNLCTATVQRTPICRIRRHRGNFPRSWSVTIKSAFIEFFVAGRPHIKYCGTPVNTPHLWAKDSPTCANYALQRTAIHNAKEYPEAAQAVLENFYMNN